MIYIYVSSIINETVGKIIFAIAAGFLASAVVNLLSNKKS
jgi:hypothetical protein